jgi:hypothetical protein
VPVVVELGQVALEEGVEVMVSGHSCLLPLPCKGTGFGVELE